MTGPSRDRSRARFRDGHLGETLRWSGQSRIDGRTIAIAALGMAVPAFVGLAAGHPDAGYTVGLGAMLLAGEPATPGAEAKERPSPIGAVAPAVLAVLVATVIAGAPWTDAAMIALAGAAAVVSGYSRPVAIGAIRLIVYLVLSATLLDAAGGHRGWAALVFGAGALWNMAMRLMLAGAGPKDTAAAAPARSPTPAQRRAHLRRTLRDLSGWQFPIRLVVGLSLASVLRHLWPSHHYSWIVLTVAILTQRQVESLPVKITQRTIGALLGVALTWAILSNVTSPVLVGLLICILATAATLARARNYLAYATTSTPVILLVLDFGKRVEPSLLTDRLVATGVGAAIVVAANLVLNFMLRPKNADA